MWRCVLILLPLLAWAGTLQVEIRQSEVWLTGDGQSRQLTHDGKSKVQAALSPSQNRVAYLGQCSQEENCTFSVVVLDLEGRRLLSFHLESEKSCNSILSMAWTGESAITAECHINPSLSEYIEIDISTGRATRDLLGRRFTPSPDGKVVAHVGWIVHFAPPYAQSNYLQVDHTTIYPLPKGTKPVEQARLAEPPDVVRIRGPTYYGIPDFQSELSWSSDSQRVALIDCTYDWTPNSPASLSGGDGKESGRRCSIAAVSTSGELALFPLSDVSPRDIRTAQLSWLNPHQLSLSLASLTRTFRIP